MLGTIGWTSQSIGAGSVIGRPTSMCHHRASEHASEGWPGDPRLFPLQQRKSWVAGPSPAMTRGLAATQYGHAETAGRLAFGGHATADRSATRRRRSSRQLHQQIVALGLDRIDRDVLIRRR